jgi:hypothetical protein
MSFEGIAPGPAVCDGPIPAVAVRVVAAVSAVSFGIRAAGDRVEVELSATTPAGTTVAGTFS